MKTTKKSEKTGFRLAVDVPNMYIKLLDELTKEYVSRSDVVRKYIMNGLIGDGKLTVSGDVLAGDILAVPITTREVSQEIILCDACISGCHDLCVSQFCPCADGDHRRRK